MAGYSPALVISIHGIRTHARWQKKLAEILGDRRIPFRIYDYGYYPVWKFLIGPLRRAMVDRFCEYYTNVIHQKGLQVDPNDCAKRPSVIAHSFGTYIVGCCLQKYEFVKFDKVILCGSILPRDFDWGSIFKRRQVNMVRNDWGKLDRWTRIVGRFVHGTGTSGNEGFQTDGLSLRQRAFEQYGHSDCLKQGHIENEWVPFLRRPPVVLRLVHGRELKEHLRKYEGILNAINRTIDVPNFRSLRGFLDQNLPRGLSTTWVSKEPDIYTLLLDEEDIVHGYLDALPVDEETFAKVLKGEVKDNEIEASHVCRFDKGARLKVYLMSIGISGKLRRMEDDLARLAFKELLNGFLEKLIFHAGECIRVTDFAAVGWTVEGEKLCKLLGMKKVVGVDSKEVKDKYGNPVYHLALNNERLCRQERMFPRIKELLAKYRGQQLNI